MTFNFLKHSIFLKYYIQRFLAIVHPNSTTPNRPIAHKPIVAPNKMRSRAPAFNHTGKWGFDYNK